MSLWILKLRFWLSEHTGPVGILIGALGIAIVATPFLIETGPRVQVSGLVTALGRVEHEEGTFGVAYVQVGARNVRVNMHRRADCPVGSTIQLARATHLYGVRHAAVAAACRRPEPPQRATG